MSKIKKSRQEVFTTTDGEIFADFDKARKHQMYVSEKELAPKLTALLEKMFDLPTHDEINDLYDSDRDGDYQKGEEADKKLDDFFRDTCDNMGWVDDMDDLVSYLAGVYEAFGLEKLQEIMIFIEKEMGI